MTRIPSNSPLESPQANGKTKNGTENNRELIQDAIKQADNYDALIQLLPTDVISEFVPNNGSQVIGAALLGLTPFAYDGSFNEAAFHAIVTATVVEDFLPDLFTSKFDKDDLLDALLKLGILQCDSSSQKRLRISLIQEQHKKLEHLFPA